MAKQYLGVEFGSTRIKAVTIDDAHCPVSGGDYTWKSTFENGVWTDKVSVAFFKSEKIILKRVHSLADILESG